jgi:hypothetical protein
LAAATIRPRRLLFLGALPVVIAGCAPPTLASVYAGAAGKKAWNVEHRVGDAHAAAEPSSDPVETLARYGSKQI